MPGYRLSVLLPVRSLEQKAAAASTLEELRYLFPKGGSSFSRPANHPVIWGWWEKVTKLPSGRKSKNIIFDDLVLIQVDGEAVTPDKASVAIATAVDEIAKCFRFHYRDDIAEDVIYITEQDVEVHARSGRPPEQEEKPAKAASDP